MTTAGWYPNPDGSKNLRYWDGNGWSEHEHPGLPVATTPGSWPAQAAQPFRSPAESNSLATAALVLGVLGAIIEWGGILTLAAAVLAIVFGAIGVSRASRMGGLGRGKAIAGVILGCFAFVAYLVWGLVTFGFLWIV